MSVAKFGSYLHNDATTPHKGAAIVADSGNDDFAAMAARLAYGAEASTWTDVTAAFPDIDGQRRDLGAEVGAIVVMRLDRGQVGRVDVLVDGDRAVAVKVLAATDFGARTPALADHGEPGQGPAPNNLSASAAGAVAVLLQHSGLVRGAGRGSG
jgi:hypothetical protein